MFKIDLWKNDMTADRCVAEYHGTVKRLDTVNKVLTRYGFESNGQEVISEDDLEENRFGKWLIYHPSCYGRAKVEMI